MHELILGGARSGKSRAAETRAAAWLAVPGRSAVLVATALAADDEMQQRIAQHRADRRARVPLLATREEPLALPEALAQAAPERLLVVDCLTLWMTNLHMPAHGRPLPDAEAREAAFVAALAAARGPVVMVSNEIGLGVMPISAEARRFVDAIGRLHQRVAAVCERVTLMVAGIEVPVKGPR